MLNRHFSKEDIQMANKCVKRYSISLANMEMQVKTTMKYHFTSTRIAIKKKKRKEVLVKKWRTGFLIHWLQ